MRGFCPELTGRERALLRTSPPRRKFLPAILGGGWSRFATVPVGRGDSYDRHRRRCVVCRCVTVHRGLSALRAAQGDRSMFSATTDQQMVLFGRKMDQSPTARVKRFTLSVASSFQHIAPFA